MNQTGVYKLSKGPDKKERTNHDDYVGMQKGAYFKKKWAIFSTTLQIGVNTKL